LPQQSQMAEAVDHQDAFVGRVDQLYDVAVDADIALLPRCQQIRAKGSRSSS
jgi:hypothetical protein